MSITSKKTNNETLRISISDTGHGISDDQKHKIFEPFHRSDAYERGVDGTGIGLSISKDFMELMGGHVGVVSEQGKGSTFWIELNLSEKVQHLSLETEEILPDKTCKR